MKIYTILGASNGIRIDANKQKQVSKAKYKFSQNFEIKSLKREKYINMFSLLLDNKEHFNADLVVAIYTNLAQKRQKEMLEVEFDEDFKYKFDENYLIKDENNFYEVLKVINKVTQATQEESILDLTHGFRHLPILATISLISQNFQSNKNIKHILFAKEFKKDEIDYEIIDLKEYLEIANLTIILENFSDNYTISSNVTFDNDTFQEVADDLRLVSNHILANSFKKIYEDDTLKKLIISLENLKSDEKLSGFNFHDILNHIKELKSLENKKDYERFYELSKMLSSRGYLLNAITLLYEASRYFAVKIIRNISPEISKSFDLYLAKQNNRKFYLLTSFSANFIQKGKVDRYKKSYPNPNNQILNQKFDKIIRDFKGSSQNTQKLGKLIENLGKFRNNLAHGNENIKENNAKNKLTNFQKEFSNLIYSAF